MQQVESTEQNFVGLPEPSIDLGVFIMKPLITVMLAVSLLFMPALADDLKDKQDESIKANVTIEVPAVNRLSDVKVIFIKPFGGTGMEIVRDKVMMRLMKAGLCIADSIDKADAILSADGQSSSNFRFGLSPGFNGYGTYGGGRSIFETELAARLTNKANNLLWAGEVRSGWPFNRSNSASSSSAASGLVKRLCKDISKDREAQIAKTQTSTY